LAMPMPVFFGIRIAGPSAILQESSTHNFNMKPRLSFIAFLLVWCIGLATSHASSVSHVVQISIDGLGAKYLEFYLTNAPAQFPTFVRLTAEGASTMNARCDYDSSDTIPNHTSMFTGRPVLQPAGMPNTTHHGYNNNFPGFADTIHTHGNPHVPYKASMFDVAHDYGLSTAFFAGKTRLTICDRSYDAVNGAPDLIGDDNGRDKIDESAISDAYEAPSIVNQVNGIVAALESSPPKHYTFIHIAEPDITGHFYGGWGSANWSNAVRFADGQLKRILDAIDANPALSNRTAVIVSTDHGGVGFGHSDYTNPTNYIIPFFVRAPGLPAGVDAYSLFSNRGNPGGQRTDYTTHPQPLRNSDGSNLALALLGLPPIPGSLVVPVFATREVSLRIARFHGQIGIFWSDPANEYVLESTEVLGENADWTEITSGIETMESTKVFTLASPEDLATRYFRLRK
jgi:hypothetical protein